VAEEEDLELDVEGGKKKGGSNVKMIIVISLIVVLLIGLSVTVTLLLLGGDKAAPAAEGHATEHAAEKTESGHDKKDAASGGTTEASAYLDLTPPFVVNLEGSETSDIRFLQVSVSVRVASDADLEILKKHMPVIRHNLNFLFGDLDFNDIRSREGKKKLADKALEVVREALKKATGNPVVEAVYFNSLVGQ